MTNFTWDELRKLTLDDNLAWLRAFGCEVRHRSGMIYVHHDELPEYCGWLFVEASPPALLQLGEIMHLPNHLDPVYVDESAATPAVMALLAGRTRAESRNVTVAAPLPRRRWRSALKLRKASLDDAAEWSSIYSRGFRRTGNDGAVDRRRWSVAFGSETIDHWFIAEDQRRIGVCQTTRGRVRGIYSFTLLPEVRTPRTLSRALGALFAVLAAVPDAWIYYEALGKSTQGKSRIQPVLGMRLVRAMTGYHRIEEA